LRTSTSSVGNVSKLFTFVFYYLWLLSALYLPYIIQTYIMHLYCPTQSSVLESEAGAVTFH